MVPTIGRIVIYTLTESDAERINKRRSDMMSHLASHQAASNGAQLHFGDTVKSGDRYPMVIVRTWGETEHAAVNGQVMLNGNDVFWVTSVIHGEKPGSWVWPPRV